MFIVCLCGTILVASKLVVGEMCGSGSRYLFGGLLSFTLFFLSDICSLYWGKDTEDMLRILFLSVAILCCYRIAQEFRLYVKKQKRKAEFERLKAKREREERRREEVQKLLERNNYYDSNRVKRTA